MRFENRIFDGIEYTLVEIYHTEKYGDIYHFASDTSDIFCKKIDNSYIQIKDETIINEIIETYNLKEPEIFFMVNPLMHRCLKRNKIEDIQKLSTESKETIINEQVQKLLELKFPIDETSFKEKLSKAIFYSAAIKSKTFVAFYHPATNSIIYNHNDIIPDNIRSKRIHLHEIIHALSGRFAFFSGYLRIKRINGGCN